MYGVEFLGAISAGVDKDTVGATGVVFEEARAVVNMAVDDDPGGIGGVVLLNLGHGEHFGGGVHEWGRDTLL